MSKLYPNGKVTVAVTDDIAIFTEGTVQIFNQLAPSNIPSVPFLSSTLTNGEVVLTPGSTISAVVLEAGVEPVYYEVGVAPTVSKKDMNSIELSTPQAAPAAVTVSATLTTANLTNGIITVNEGGAGASAQQLPLATDLDTALPAADVDYSFDFTVLNISTVAAESATITVNTGWTLVGDIAIQANNASTTKSVGRFRARKTAAGAWTLYRIA